MMFFNIVIFQFDHLYQRVAKLRSKGSHMERDFLFD